MSDTHIVDSSNNDNKSHTIEQLYDRAFGIYVVDYVKKYMARNNVNVISPDEMNKICENLKQINVSIAKQKIQEGFEVSERLNIEKLMRGEELELKTDFGVQYCNFVKFYAESSEWRVDKYIGIEIERCNEHHLTEIDNKTGLVSYLCMATSNKSELLHVIAIRNGKIGTTLNNYYKNYSTSGLESDPELRGKIGYYITESHNIILVYADGHGYEFNVRKDMERNIWIVKRVMTKNESTTQL